MGVANAVQELAAGLRPHSVYGGVWAAVAVIEGDGARLGVAFAGMVGGGHPASALAKDDALLLQVGCEMGNGAEIQLFGHLRKRVRVR